MSKIIVLIVDASGSMRWQKEDVVKAINAFIDQQKSAGDACAFSLIYFADTPTMAIREAPIGEVKYDGSTYVTVGHTALYDAINFGIIEHLAYDEALVIIITDGKENASTSMTREEIQIRIQIKRDLGWNFLYLGNSNAIQQQGIELGISGDSSGVRAKSDSVLVDDLAVGISREASDAATEFRVRVDDTVQTSTIGARPPTLTRTVTELPGEAQQNGLQQNGLQQTEEYKRDRIVECQKKLKRVLCPAEYANEMPDIYWGFPTEVPIDEVTPVAKLARQNTSRITVATEEQRRQRIIERQQQLGRVLCPAEYEKEIPDLKWHIPDRNIQDEKLLQMDEDLAALGLSIPKLVRQTNRPDEQLAALGLSIPKLIRQTNRPDEQLAALGLSIPQLIRQTNM